MEFYSHCDRDKNNKIIDKKKLIEHHSNVTSKIIDNLNSSLGFSLVKDDEFEKIAHFLGNLHDHGKYTSFFQDYLINQNDHGKKKNHALISAVLCFNLLKNKKIVENDLRNIIPYFIYFCIRSHHGNLKNILVDPLKGFNVAAEKHNLNLQKDDLFNNLSQIKKELWDPSLDIKTEFYDPPEEDIVNITNWLQSRLKSIENYFFVQYLFSLLIESDKLDASNTATYSLKPINEIAVDNYLKKLSTDNEIDDKRNEVKRKILSCLDNIDVANQSLFTLTAPTGIGKTLASLNFVLHLKEKCKNQNGQEPLIVYTLPFINIIEQTVKEFEKVFKNDDVKIVKHHQYTDLYDKNEKISINNLIMQLETWQGDLIVTTFVQLFQTIIGNRNSLLKKFHRLANSIIILDEIQNIDVKYWPLIGSVLYYLTKFLKSKIILMTATQPFLFETAKQHILTNENINITPLLPDYQKYFKALQRTKLIPLIDEKLNDENDFFELFNKHWNPSKSALIVVNTIARSLAVYNLLEEQFPDTTIFYLSTNIIPRCRQVVIYQIRKALKRKEKIILVSTQCVEAGVDLDFNMGFRDLAPLDSIIQVAGRVNRNNKIPEPCPVYIFEFEKDASLVYGAILPSRSKMVLQEINKQEIYENNFLDLIQKYFSLIVSQDGKSMEPSKEIFTAMEKLRFTKLDNETEKSVSDFQLIESRYGYVDVFVCLNRKSERILSHFQNRYLNEEDNSKKRIEYLKIKKGFNSHIISIPKNKLGGLKSFQLLDNLNYIPLNQLEQYYKLDSGFIRSSEDHSMIF